MTISITPIYAGLLALFYLLLSARVIRLRQSLKVGMGDGGQPGLIRSQRAHGNFSEYVPLTLILMMLAEVQGQPAQLIHLIGGLLLAGRLIHAWAISHEPGPIKGRVLGMLLTFGALLIGGLSNLQLGSLMSLVSGG